MGTANAMVLTMVLTIVETRVMTLVITMVKTITTTGLGHPVDHFWGKNISQGTSLTKRHGMGLRTA